MLKASPGRHGENGIPQKLELQIKIERASKHLSRFSMKILCFKKGGFQNSFQNNNSWAPVEAGSSVFLESLLQREKLFPGEAIIGKNYLFGIKREQRRREAPL